MKQRTRIDFSKHEVRTTELPNGMIYKFGEIGSPTHALTFVVTCGITAVTGDFGNWIFCREFYPDGDTISDGYWDEKLEIASEQKAEAFDTETVGRQLDEFIAEFENNYGRGMTEEESEFFDDLKAVSDNEIEYISTIWNEIPPTLDASDLPQGKTRHAWLNSVYDGFEAMCRKLKTETEEITK
jgi:hypothetical protein